MAIAFGHYNSAIIARVPNSIVGVGELTEMTPVKEKLKTEQMALIRILREKCHLDLLELPPDDQAPKGCFLEDLAIVFNENAFLTYPSNVDSERRAEIKALRLVLEEYGLAIEQMEYPLEGINYGTGESNNVELQSIPKLDGGDILYTGYEFFIGTSNNTNGEGALQFAKRMTDISVTLIRLDAERPNTRLKDVVSMVMEGVLSVPDTPLGQAIRKQIINNSSFDYKVLYMPAEIISNCLFINNFLLHADEKSCSKEVFAKFNTELSKLDGEVLRVPVPSEEFVRLNITLSRRALLFRAPDASLNRNR